MKCHDFDLRPVQHIVLLGVATYLKKIDKVYLLSMVHGLEIVIDYTWKNKMCAMELATYEML